MKTVLEQGVHSGADHQGKKDDVFLEIQFTITEALERYEGNKKGAGKNKMMNRALRETGRGEHRTGRL